MKFQKPLFLTFLTVAVVSVLSTLCATLVCQSEFFINTKYSFAAVILVGTAFVICCLINAEYKSHRDACNKEIGKYRDEADKYKDRVLELSEENAALNDRIGYYTSGAVQEEFNALKEKCDTIEAFRNSFPYKIADGYVLYNIIRTELIPGSHSTWLLVGQFGEELWSCSIIRSTAQSYKEILTLAAATGAPEDLEQLDQSETILWK